MKTSDSKPKITPLTPIIRKVMESNEWNFDFDPENDRHNGDIFNLGIRGENVNLRVIVVADNEDGRMMVRCSPQWYVPADKREQALRVINRLNYDKWFTRVALDMDDGELNFIQTATTAGLKPTEEFVQDLIFLALNVADDDTRTIMESVFGGNIQSDRDNEEAENEADATSIDINWTPRSDN